MGLSTNMPSCCSYIHLVFSFIAARDHGQRWPRRQRVAFQSLPTNTRMTSDLPLDSFTAFPSHYTPPASSSPATRTERQCHCQPEKRSGRVNGDDPLCSVSSTIHCNFCWSVKPCPSSSSSTWPSRYPTISLAVAEQSILRIVPGCTPMIHGYKLN